MEYPTSAPQSPRFPKALVIGGGIALAVLIIGIAFVCIRYAGFLFASTDTRSLAFVEQDYDGGVYATGRFGIKMPGWTADFTPYGAVMDAAQAGEVRAALVRPTGATGFVALYVTDASGTREIPTMPGEKRWLTVSPDGMRVAYATFVPPRPGTVSSSDIGDWSVESVSLGDGGVTTHGTGYGPQFVGDSRLLMSSKSGLVITDLDSGLRSEEPSVAPAETGDVAVASPDGTRLLVRDARAGAYLLFAIESSNPVRLGLLRTIPSMTLAGPVFRGDWLYFLNSREGGESTLVRYPSAAEGEPKDLLTFPHPTDPNTGTLIPLLIR